MKSPAPQQVKQVRTDAGLSVTEAARRMEVSRQTVHNWESGRHPMLPRDFKYYRIILAPGKS